MNIKIRVSIPEKCFRPLANVVINASDLQGSIRQAKMVLSEVVTLLRQSTEVKIEVKGKSK